jgi:hypothetical protein
LALKTALGLNHHFEPQYLEHIKHLIELDSFLAPFELDDKVQDETGKTVTHRLDGRTNELSLEGVLTSAATFVLSIGDKIVFAGNEVAFTGCITRIEDRGQNKGFTLISISATEYEAITY